MNRSIRLGGKADTSGALNVLLVHPVSPPDFFSAPHANRILGTPALAPPLGLLTIASLLPDRYGRRLVDMNTRKLCDQDIEWADYVFVSATIGQEKGVDEITGWCKTLNKPVVVGGPLFTYYWEQFENIDRFVLKEGKNTLPELLDDLQRGSPKRVYSGRRHFWLTVGHSLLRHPKKIPMMIELIIAGSQFMRETETLLRSESSRNATIQKQLDEKQKETSR